MSDSQKETKDFIHQILLVLFGAVIAFVPSLILTTYQARLQAHEQREQFMLDKKIAALKDLSAAVNGNGKLLADFDRWDRYLIVAISFPENEANREQLMRLDDELNMETPRYIAELRTQAAITGVLFHIQIPYPKFAVEDLPFEPEEIGPSKKQTFKDFARHCKETRIELVKTKKELTELIDTYQGLISDLSKELH